MNYEGKYESKNRNQNNRKIYSLEQDKKPFVRQEQMNYEGKYESKNRNQNNRKIYSLEQDTNLLRDKNR
jgi:hypothetical protein